MTETHLDVQTLTLDRYTKQVERTSSQQGYGSTHEGLAIVSKYLNDTIRFVSDSSIPEDISILPHEIIALVCLQVGISSVANEETLSQTIYTLGAAAEREVYAQKLRDKAGADKKRKAELERMTKAIMKRHGSVAYRKTALKAAAQRAGLGAPDWTSKQQAHVGAWLVDVCLSTPVFHRVEAAIPHLSLTEEAQAIAHTIVERLLKDRPNMLPLLAPPAPWETSTAVISGYKHLLIRKHDKVVQSHIKKAIGDGRMAPVLEAINLIQNTAFKINPFILEMIHWSYANSVKIDGFPRAWELDKPEKTKPWEEMTEEEQRVWKKTASDIAKANRANASERLMLTHDLKVAEYIGSQTFWVAANMDYRGRVYSIGNFNFQRQDHIRALFLFSEGKPLDTEGLYWLKVHLANTGDFGKVSKATFADRVQWVDANLKRILEMAAAPQDDLWWTEADCPFLFLAAARALWECLLDPSTPCHVPVSFDGSCSGLQHLAAMTKDEETAYLVNLMERAKPGDVYQTVADKAKLVIEDDREDEEWGVVAQKCLDYGVNRSLVKRNVMTYSYSSGRFGMAQQHMEDTMIPLSFKVLEGKLDDHPLAVEGDITPGHKASRYLAGRVYTSIEDTVKRPAEAMRFLQGLARATAHEGKPLIWHTPLGLPVVLRYPVYNSSQVTLFLHDRGVKLRFDARMQTEAKGIDKSKAAGAVASGFTHSLDAAHLQQVVRMAADEGINSVALVHDSFGCLPTDAGRFRRIIKEAFVWLYSHDVLENIRQETCDQVQTNGHRIPDLPEYGAYDINQIMEAEYAFA